VTKPYAIIADLSREVETPGDGTFSRTIYQDERLKAVLFSFSAGQELSEHTASSPAIMHFLGGQADVTVGEEKVAANAGTWIHMAAQVPHSIRSKSPVEMLLLLLKSGP